MHFSSMFVDFHRLFEGFPWIPCQETVWKAVPEHYRRLDRCLKRIGAEELPFDAPRKPLKGSESSG